MITYQDQLDLFSLISRNLEDEVECWAFGGTAMLFHGYKDETKDIDLLFTDENDRDTFIQAIEQLGFKETTPASVYKEKKARHENKPVMYERQEARFDLFANNVFQSRLSPSMQEEKEAVHEFTQGTRLTLNVFTKEHLAYLKAVTERDRDVEDVLTIIRKSRDFSWEKVTDEAVRQCEHGDDRALLDLEQTMQDLKEYEFIPEQHFEALYEAQDDART